MCEITHRSSVLFFTDMSDEIDSEARYRTLLTDDAIFALKVQNVMIHFDDALVPQQEQEDTVAHVEGHF